MIKNRKAKFSFLLLLLFLLGACFVFAQGRELEIKYPVIPGIEIPATTETAFPVYVRYIFNLAIMIAGIVAFGALVFGGIRYLISGGSPSTQKDASGQIAAAFFSLIILLSSYLILFTIDPKLVVFNSPELKIIPAPTLNPIPPEERIYTYLEIPTGYFIDKALEKEKLDKIDEFSKEILQKVEELKNLAQELENLIKNCQCGRTISVDSLGSSCKKCTYGQLCSCTACAGNPGTQNDPCPNRSEINQKKEEILKKVEEIRGLKEKLEEQKGILIKDLANLKKAGELMAGCYDGPLNYENLVVMQNIFKIEIEKLEEWKSFQPPVDQANFYCKK